VFKRTGPVLFKKYGSQSDCDTGLARFVWSRENIESGVQVVNKELACELFEVLNENALESHCFSPDSR
jgi:hypothetical protein